MSESEENSQNQPSEENSQDKQSEENCQNKQSNDTSSSEVEIRLNEYLKRSELSVLDIRALVVRCSSCGRQINHHSNKDIRKHRRLGVLTCKECYDFYGSSEFSQDEAGYKYCTWCGNGGKLLVCDYCPNGFCSACIRRNFGRAEISIVSKEGWSCYCCNSIRLNPKVKFCDLIMETEIIKKPAVKKEKRPVSKTHQKVTEKWLQAAFDESEEACEHFHKKMTKLKAIGVNKSKGLKHIVKKMEQVINSHKLDLKNIVKNLSKEFTSYIELQIKSDEGRHSNEINDNNGVDKVVDENDKSSDVIFVDSTNETQSNNDDCVVIDATPKKVDCLVIEETPEKNESVEDKSLAVESQDVNNIEEEKIRAKLSLLQTSSESGGEDSATSTRGGQAINSSHSVSLSVTEKNSMSDDSICSPKVKRKLNLDTPSSSDSESLFKQKSNAGKTHHKGINVQDVNKTVKEVDIETDPKLKLQTVVGVVSCGHLLNGESSVTVGCSDTASNLDSEDKLDKRIDSLCKFPKHKASNGEGKQRTAGPVKHKAPAQETESSSSISLSSDDEADKKQAVTKAVKKDTKKAENALTSESSSSLFLDSEDEEKVKKSKKLKVRRIDSDSDDFQPKKKRKYDKLLHGPLLSDDEKKPKEKKEKKESKKRTILLDSDDNKQNKGDRSSSAITSESDDNKQKGIKKRKRIKKIESSSDEKDKGNTPAGKGQGRKNIKKIITGENLSQTTKEAQLIEKDRRKRIEERQLMYNKIQDILNDGKEIITRKMVMEVDKESKEEIVEIHPDLVCKLKPHQVNGVKFMWECTIESVKDLDKPGSGCILAHCMGLGKTLQVIAFLHTCLTNSIVKKKIKRGMVICPYNTALNWASEFDYWLQDVEGDIKVHQLATAKSNGMRLDILEYWFNEGGVIITSYDTFRRLAQEKISRLKIRERKLVHKYLLDPGPDIVVCDEGHILKNETSAISKAASRLITRRRIVLTGTPLQNNLQEYHCMLSFVKPNLLGTAKEFRNRFVNPIINGQYDDSNDRDVKLMKKRIHILHKLLEGCVQRCDYSALTKFLPPKHEFVISVKLSEVQMKMYECYLEKLSNAKKDKSSKIGSTLFVDFNNFRCIWSHPYMCHLSHQRLEYKKLYRDDSEEEFINDATEPEKSSSSSSSSDDDLFLINPPPKPKTRSQVKDDDIEEIEEEEVKQWYHEYISDEDKCNIQISGKIVLLMDILKECEAIGDKIIVFSQSLLALDSIEEILRHSDSQPVDEEDKLRDVLGNWIKGLDYFRMDGATSADFRKSFIDMFNDPMNVRARLFLISTRAGSLGTNLVGANRVVVFDTSWNPSHDVQAIFRVYRFGQIKPVYIYRLLAQGTMEEKIYDRQVTKLSLSCRVVDEQQIDRHFSAADLAELYQFDRNATTNRPTPMVPKDRLLAEMLIKNKDWIVTYHEHDSLLQHQVAEDLTEDERQAAWTEYENEREGKVVNNSGLNEADMNAFAREPDFTSMDYEGRMIPDLKIIVENLYERLNAEMPGHSHSLEFKRKLLFSVLKIRHVFQEKHVKVLRLKQEFVARGTVPNAVNKYMDELAVALKSTGDYIMRLQSAVSADEERFRIMRQQSVPQQAAYVQQVQGMRFPSNQRAQGPPIIIRGGRVPQMSGARVIRMPNQRFPFQGGRPMYAYANNNARNNARNPTVSEPTITEVDDRNSVPANNAMTSTSNKKSTVVIEEIL